MAQDLYASITNSTPGPQDSTYRSNRGYAGGSMAEDVIRVPPPGSAQNVYFSVYQYSDGRGGFRTWDNLVGSVQAVRAGSQQNLLSTGQYTLATQSLQRVTAGLYQSFDGLHRVSAWDFYMQPPSPTNCDGNGNTCSVYLWSEAYCDLNLPDVLATCPIAGCTSSGWNQINDCAWFDNFGALYAQTMAHEIGHCRYEFLDEYNAATGSYAGWHCGHSAMAQVTAVNTLFDFCTAQDHLKDFYNPDAYPESLNSNWRQAQLCAPSQFANYYVSTTPDPERWDTSDIFSDAGSPVFTPVILH